MSKKMWGGRYSKNTEKTVEEFTQSVSFDRRLAPYDIIGSIAHVKMLAKCKVIKAGEKDKIVKGLKGILQKVEKGSFVFKPELEDVHMNIEKALTDSIGEAGAKLHTARSRNDQVSLDMRLYLRDQIGQIIEGLVETEKSLIKLADKYKGVIISGYTHLQQAQPVLFGHHLLAYVEMFDRDKDRLKDCMKRVNLMPLGACALAGTSIKIDRNYVAKELGFDGVCHNSMDAVSDRDFVAEFLSAAAIIGMHLSRLSEEIVLWASKEFDLIDIDEAYCTGSSIMPQKKNPDVAELLRGKSGRLYGNLMSVMVMMKGLPLSYNRDMQEDKEPVFDSVDTIKASLNIISGLLLNVKVNVPDEDVFKGGFSYATDMAEYLVKKGMSFRKAHGVIGKLIGHCNECGKEVSDMTFEQLRKVVSEFDKNMYALVSLDNCIASKKSYGGTSFNNVEKALLNWKKKLK